MAEKNQTVQILGTEYTVEIKGFEEDESFEKRGISGYCDSYRKRLVICDLQTMPDIKEEPLEILLKMQKEGLRHEVIHAFLHESGLTESSAVIHGGWATNEEMVDWFAMQSPKIYRIFKQLEILND